MQDQIFDRLIYHQDYLSTTGRIGRGPHISVGYLLDRDKNSPTYRHLILFPLHADIMLALYERNRELGNNIYKLWREQKDGNFIFSDFPEGTDQRHINSLNLTKVPGGYIFGNRNSLRRALCNPVNIGWMRNGSDVVRGDDGEPRICHEPLVPVERQQELFWYAYNGHATVLPDGTENPAVKRAKGITPAYNVLLRPVLVPEDENYHVTTGLDGKSIEGKYIFYDKRDECGPGRWSIAAPMLDGVFWKMLRAHVLATQPYKDLEQVELQALANSDIERKEIQAQIDACDRIIKRQQQKFVVLGELDTDEEDVQSTKPTHLSNKSEKEALALLIKSIRDEIQYQMQERKRLIGRLTKLQSRDRNYAQDTQQWSKIIRSIESVADFQQYIDRDEHENMINVFVEKAVIYLLSPRVVSLTVYWRYRLWGIEQALWLRGSPSRRWTSEEITQLAAFFERGIYTPEEAVKAVRTRSYEAIYLYAYRSGYRPILPSHIISIPELNNVAVTDYEVMQQYGLVSRVPKILNVNLNIKSLLAR